MNADELDTYAWQLLESAGDAVVIADPEGQITFWNVGAESMFGHSSAEAVGQSLDLIVPDRLRARHWAGYLETMRTGTTSYADRLLAVPAIRRDGTRISIEFRVTLLFSEGSRTPSAIAAIIRDVTEHWEEDRGLRERLRALESAVPEGSTS